MQKVIGLDIGSYSIKIVEILNTFNSYEIVNFYENVIPYLDEVSPEILIPVCMEQLFSENNLKVDRIITAMPGQYVSSRIMSFNFTDPRKIENAVLAEVEEVVPYDLDEMIVDHQILGQVDDKTVAMAVMTRKAFMRSFLSHLHHINIDPKLIDIDSLSFYNLNPYLGLAPGECAALVDIGHEKTSVCIVQDHILRMFRSINLGGRYLTEFLSRDLEVGFNEAQRIKHLISRIISNEDNASDLPEKDRIIAQRLTLACNAIVKELGRTFYAFKKWEKSPIKKIILSGGTSRMQNLERYLSEQLEIEVVKNRLDLTSLKINPVLNKYTEVMPQGISIGMRAISSIKRHTSINLRKGEFAYVQDYESIIKITATVSKYMGVAAALLIMAYIAQYFFYRAEIKDIEDKYTKAVATVFTDAKKNNTKDPFTKIVSNTKNRFRAEIEEKSSVMQQFYQRNDNTAPLQALADISKGLPKEIKVDLTLYQYSVAVKDGQSKIVIRGDTDSYETVAKVIEAVKKLPQFSEVTEKNSAPKPGYDNKVIDFTIQALYQSNSSPRNPS